MNDEGAAVPADSGGPQEDMPEELELVQEMVELLPESSRAVVHLFYYEQLSVRQIAQTLGITEQNVKTRLSRAREKLRIQLEGRS